MRYLIALLSALVLLSAPVAARFLHGGAGGSAGPETLITDVTVYNTGGGSVSSKPVTFVQPLAPAAVSSSQKIEIRKSDGTTVVSNYQESQCSTWLQDGSRKACAISFVKPDTITAGGSATYKLYSVTGSPSTGCNVSSAQIQANTNFIVKSTGQDLGAAVFDVSLNDILANGSQLPASGSPLQYWEYTASGPSRCGIHAVSYLKRESNSAYHKWMKGEIFIDFWGSGSTPCPCSITYYHKQSNIYGAQPGASEGASTQPGYVFQSTLYSNTTPVAYWGGANDPKVMSLTSTNFHTSNMTMTLSSGGQDAIYGTSPVVGNSSALPFTFTGSGLPAGLVAGTTYWGAFLQFSSSVMVLTPTQYDATTCSGHANETASNYAGRPGSPSGGQTWIFTDATVNAPGSTISTGGGTHRVLGTFSGSVWQETCEFQVITTAGSGTITAIPWAASFPRSGWAGMDTTANRYWFDASNALTTAPTITPAHNFAYLTQTSKGMLPFLNDLPITAQTGPGTLTYYPWSYAWPWDINQAGDGVGDERIGYINHTCALAIYNPSDTVATTNCRALGGSLMRYHAYFEDESVGGLPVVFNNGPAKNGVTYTNMGPINVDHGIPSNPSSTPAWPAASAALIDNDGIYERYGWDDASHMPSPWIIPYLQTAYPEWLAFGAAQANATIGGVYLGEWAINGVNYYKPFEPVMQERGTGWAMRMLGQVRHLTPATSPAYPYWGDMVSDQCSWLQKWSQYTAVSQQAALGYWYKQASLGDPDLGDHFQQWASDITSTGVGMVAWQNEYPDCKTYMTNWATRFQTNRGIPNAGGCLWASTARYVYPWLSNDDTSYSNLFTAFSSIYANTASVFTGDPDWTAWAAAGGCPTYGLFPDNAGGFPYLPVGLATIYTSALGMLSTVGDTLASSVYTAMRGQQAGLTPAFSFQYGSPTQTYPEWAIAPLGYASTPTTFTTDCNGLVTITNGGLTLAPTSTAATEHLCRANTAQFGGKVYFEVTNTGNATSQGGAGFTNKGPGLPVNQGFDITTTSQYPGSTTGGVMASFGTGFSANIDWNGSFLSSLGTYTLNKTVGIAANLDTDPPEFWMTLDVTGNSGYGGGPLWNNSNTSSPTLVGTGKAFFLPGYAVWPTYRSNGAAGTNVLTTFNFGASTFVGTKPTGYAAWNDNGQTNPTPGPTNTQTANIANAPGWTSGASYVLKNRVLAGSGWTGSAFIDAAPICLFAVKVAGTAGSDPAVFNSACTTGTPANTGGGLDGTIPSGWASATTVTDGGVTWALLTRVDYATLTGWLNDDVKVWLPSTTFNNGQYVTSPSGYSYRLMNFPNATCTTGTTPLTGTTLNTGYSDGNCTWKNRGKITYSSKANIWPHAIYPTEAAVVQWNWVVVGQLWYGGSARTVYQPGQNNENLPLVVWEHADGGSGSGLGNNDQNPQCYKVPSLHNTIPWPLCAGFQVYPVNIQPAPGDGFVDNVASSDPIKVDATKGVTLYSDAALVLPVCDYNCTLGEPIGMSDSIISVTGLQLKSEHGPALPGFGYNTPGYAHAASGAMKNNIMECGVETAICVSGDNGMRVINNAIISHSTLAGHVAIASKYYDQVTNNTVIGAGATNGTGIFGEREAFGTYEFYDNVFFGFPNPFAFVAGTPLVLAGQHNATDVSGSFSGSSFAVPAGGTLFTGSWTSAMLTGVNTSSGCGVSQASPCSGLTASSNLVGSTPAAPDLHVKSGADITGAGATYSLNVGCSTCAPYANWDGLPPSLDVFGAARPTSGRYDIGAAQFH